MVITAEHLEWKKQAVATFQDFFSTMEVSLHQVTNMKNLAEYMWAWRFDGQEVIEADGSVCRFITPFPDDAVLPPHLPKLEDISSIALHFVICQGYKRAPLTRATASIAIRGKVGYSATIYTEDLEFFGS